MTTTACNQCRDSYYINIDGSCKMLPSNCLNSNNQGYCLSCSANYTLSSGTCIIAINNGGQTTIANCLTYNSNRNLCQACNYGWYTTGASCLKASDKCLSYDMNSGKCYTCVTNYGLNSNGECLFISIISNNSNTSNSSGLRDPNCVKYSGISCI